MKKLGLWMLALSLCGFVVGCGGTSDQSAPNQPAPPAKEGATQGGEQSGDQHGGSEQPSGAPAESNELMP